MRLIAPRMLAVLMALLAPVAFVAFGLDRSSAGASSGHPPEDYLFSVPSGAMIPTIDPGQVIVVDEQPADYKPVRRFDIIVFRRTPEDSSTTDADLLKRVIGLPGETIWSKGDTIDVDGKPLNESRLPTSTRSSCPQSTYGIVKTHIPANDYFVMGDCRGNSEDSRAWGFVPSTYIVGKVFVVVWRHGHPWLHWF